MYINVNRLRGFAKATEFVFDTFFTPVSNVQNIVWNFGDGCWSNDLTTTHIFGLPGRYNVTATVQTNTTWVSAVCTVNISNYLNDAIYFQSVPPPSLPGEKNIHPFRVAICSNNTTPHTVYLYSENSRSYPPYTAKWSFLTPQWKFLNTQLEKINSLTTTDTVIRIDGDGNISPNGTVVGVTGYGDFYFVDDLSNYKLALTGLPFTTIWASLETSGLRVREDGEYQSLDLPGFSNTNSITRIPYVINEAMPEFIDISANGISQHPELTWLTRPLPFLITTKSGEETGENFNRFLPQLSTSNVPIDFTVNTTLSTIISPSSLELKQYDEYNVLSPGYAKGNIVFSSSVSSGNVQLSASLVYTTIPLSARNLIAQYWTSNPGAGTLAVFQHFASPSLSSAYIKSWEIPIIKDGDPVTTTLWVTGFHGVYSFAVVPDNEGKAWNVDSELNKCYMYNTQGHMLCSIDIAEVVRANNLGFIIDTEQVTPASIALDSNQDFWITLYDTLSVLKFNRYGEFQFATTPLANLVNTPPTTIPFYQDTVQQYTLTVSGAGSDEVNGEYTATSERYNNQIVYVKTTPPYCTIKYISLAEWHIINLATGSDEYFGGDVDGPWAGPWITGFGADPAPIVTLNTPDVNFIEPTSVDTDTQNNAWVTYSYFGSGYAVKYDSSGGLLTTISYPVCCTPHDIVIDRDDSFWVTVPHLYGPFGYVEKRDSNGVLLSSIPGLNNPSNITLDTKHNVWFTHGYNQVTTVRQNGLSRTLYLSSNILVPAEPGWFDTSVNADLQALEGIAGTQVGKVYVIHSIENQVYCIDSDTLNLVDRFIINPQGFTYNIDDVNDVYTTTRYNLWSKSLQSTGDWTGWRWMLKYGWNSYTRTITGVGNNILLYQTNPYELRKINENFDVADYMKKLSFMPVLRDSGFLYDMYMKSIFGTDTESPLVPGVAAYEKIANFLLNTTDIDTCGIDSLYSIAQSCDLSTDDYRLSYPLEVLRMMNLASVNLNQLRGIPCNCKYFFDKPNDCNPIGKCTLCLKDKHNNRGNLIDTSVYQVSAGTPVVLKEKSLGKYSFISVGPLDGQNVYSFSTFVSTIGINVDEVGGFYEFYEYNDTPNNNVVDNLIDWNNPNNTLSLELSSSNDWYGKDKILETIFNYQLHKGLGLL